MIRRKILLSNDASLWLLVSQVEHARISGELARNWKEALSPEVVNAIAHHDDGWARWEQSPKLDPGIGGPYSFLEMPLAESLSIWDDSITASRSFGPLAGYIVAGHFYNLLADSDHANEPAAIAWLTAKRKVRTAWLDEWIRADKCHTLDYAKRSQQMLLTADLFSLWLFCDCPIDAKSGSMLKDSAMKLKTDALLAQFRFVPPECTIFESGSRKRVEELSWIVPVRPSPFASSPVSLQAKAMTVPAKKYGSWQEIVAASWDIELDWQLVAAV